MDKDIQELFNFIEINLPDYANLVNRGYNKKRAKEVLILSETLLEVNQAIADKLEKRKKLTEDKFIKLSGHGQMLSQRLAKLYIAYHAGFRDAKSVEQFNKSVVDFATTLKTLISYSHNTPSVAAALTRVEDLWDVLSKIIDLEKPTLPVTILITTDNIVEEINAATNMYSQ
jgi:hypothetical protein